MTTHQQIGGLSDQEMVERMVSTSSERFNDAFWQLFDADVAPRLGSEPVVVDLGCGPGILLHALGQRYTNASLTGLDVTPAMLDYARGLSFPGVQPTFAQCDIAAEPLPMEDGSADLVTICALLHVLDDPLGVLGEIHRVLRPDGTLLLYDWRRTSLSAYIAERTAHAADDVKRWMRLFPYHNRYTVDDWRWLLDRSGFSVVSQGMPRDHFVAFVLARS